MEDTPSSKVEEGNQVTDTATKKRKQEEMTHNDLENNHVVKKQKTQVSEEIQDEKNDAETKKRKQDEMTPDDDDKRVVKKQKTQDVDTEMKPSNNVNQHVKRKTAQDFANELEMTLDGDNKCVVKKQKTQDIEAEKKSSNDLNQHIKTKTTTSAQDFANELLRRSDILRSDPHETNQNDAMPTITQKLSKSSHTGSAEKKNVSPPPQPENVSLEKCPRPLPQPRTKRSPKKTSAPKSAAAKPKKKKKSSYLKSVSFNFDF